MRALGWARSCWPLGPTFNMEVRVAGRRRITYICRSLYVLAITFVLGVTVLALFEELSTDSAALRLETMSSIAPRIALVLGWIQFALFTFIAPILTASSIIEERTKRTLPALATTPMSSLQIVLGKLSGRMVQIVILAMISIPVLLFVRLFGGLAYEPILAMVSLSLCSALFSGSLGLWFGLRARSITVAFVAALLCTALVYAYPLFEFAIRAQLGQLANGPGMGTLERMMYTNPPMAMGSVTASVSEGNWPFDMRASWMLSSATALLGATAMLALCTLRLRTVIRESVGGRPTKSTSRRTTAPRRSGTVGNHVVAWRCLRLPNFLRTTRGKLFATLISMAIIALYIFFDTTALEFHMVISILAAFAQVLVASQVAVGAISGEREARSWEVLLTTPLSGSTILVGKFLGVLPKILFIPLLMWAHLSVFATLGVVRWETTFFGPSALIATGVLLAGTGIWLSLRCKRTLFASVLNISAAIAIWVVFPLMLAIFGAIFQAPDAIEGLLTINAATNPVFMNVYSIMWSREMGVGVPATSMNFIAFSNVSPTGIFMLYAGFGITLCLAGLLALRIAIAQFPRRCGRTS